MRTPKPPLKIPPSEGHTICLAVEAGGFLCTRVAPISRGDLGLSKKAGLSGKNAYGGVPGKNAYGEKQTGKKVIATSR